MRIWIVDDDDDVREVLGLVLRGQGYEVEETVDGLDAIARLRARRGPVPSLILLDLMMPRLDGTGFMKLLRTEPRTAHIPVWIISGHAAAHQQAAELGAVGCMLKPVDLDQLFEAIRRLFSDPE